MRIRPAFVFLVATFQVAFAVSGSISEHRERGIDALDKGDCPGAVGELLAAHGDGDSSNTLLLRLSQALECDDRMVDALSATYADNKTDTTGRIELLLFRAQMLRKIGLGDEAAKVEREIGQNLVPKVATGAAVDDRNLDWSWSITGGAGWIYQDDVKKSADSLGIYESWISSNTETTERVPSRSSAIVDSVTISGVQIPCFAAFSFDVIASNWSASASIPVQISIDRDLRGWLGGGVGLDMYGSYQPIQWIGSEITAGASRNWTPVEGQDPDYQDQYSGGANVWLKGRGLSLTSSSAVGLIQDRGGSSTRRWSQGLQFGIDLPRRFHVDIGGGFGKSDDGSGAYSYTLPAWILTVRNAYPSQRLLDATILDTSGAPVGYLNKMDLLSEIPRFWTGKIDSNYSIPFSSPQDWSRWSASLGLSHNPWTNFGWSAGFELGRTELDLLQQGVLVEPIESWAPAVGAVRIFRDSVSGIDYVSFPGTSAKLVPLKWARRRTDIHTTFRLAIRYRPTKHVSLRAGWTYTENESNLKHIADFASYTRNVWNVSASVGW